MTQPFSIESRNDFPRILNWLGLKGAAVEVGVNQGHYSEHFLEQWAGELLISVDAWGPYAEATPEQREADYAATKARLERFGDRSAVWRSTSVNAAKHFMLDPQRQGGFDFVYIDGDHSYRSVTADLEAWWPLVKPGGIIAGHDWIPDGWRFYGDSANTVRCNEERATAPDGTSKNMWPCFVRKAVNDFFADRLQQVMKTSDNNDGGWSSWWLRK